MRVIHSHVPERTPDDILPNLLFASITDHWFNLLLVGQLHFHGKFQLHAIYFGGRSIYTNELKVNCHKNCQRDHSGDEFTSNMRPPKTTRRVLNWFCVHLPEENTHKWKKRAYIAFAASASAINWMSSVSDAIYFSRSLSIDSEKSLLALMQGIANGTMVYVIVIEHLLRKKIVAIIESLIHGAIANLTL